MSEITRARFEFALTHLKGSDWERFEKLASTFLASQWPEIRTMASYSGDGGRDAELFNPVGQTNVAIQYSLRQDWSVKIAETISRLKEKHSNITLLVYCTNQTIGAAGDTLKASAVQKGIFLDIRDLSWFAERANTDASRSKAAEDLAMIIVDPITQRLTASGQTKNVFNAQEASTALVYLELQLSDDKRDKGLTKSAFEALVRAGLGGTHTESRIPKQVIMERIAKMLPQHGIEALEPYVGSALQRLKKGPVKHHTSDDTYCLSHDEVNRINELAIENQLLNEEFDIDVLSIAASIGPVEEDHAPLLLETFRTVLGKYFLLKGEEFASAIEGDLQIRPSHTDLQDVVVSQIGSLGQVKFTPALPNAEFLLRLSNALFREASDATLDYLRLMADSYTLFAFLEETPDVQKSTSKLFGHGDVWLDTTALLPVFAEAAAPSSASRPFTQAFKQARNASLKLYITPGVLEETERHLNKCKAFAISNNWIGRIPFVMQQYILAGRKPSTFHHWIETFCGSKNAEQDIADYLQDEFGIEVRVERPGDGFPADVVTTVKEYWNEVQDKRRGQNDEFSMSANRLAQHDIESHLTVLSQRQSTVGLSKLGQRAWWLTLDQAAWAFYESMRADAPALLRSSALMSIDFLIKYLAFGPNRSRVVQADLVLTQVFESNLIEAPKDLLEVARTVREKFSGAPDRIVQRKIRDALDDARTASGAIQKGGLAHLNETLGNFF